MLAISGRAHACFGCPRLSFGKERHAVTSHRHVRHALTVSVEYGRVTSAGLITLLKIQDFRIAASLRSDRTQSYAYVVTGIAVFSFVTLSHKVIRVRDDDG